MVASIPRSTDVGYLPSVLRRSLRLGRSCPWGELLQSVALVPRGSSNRRIVLRQFHRAVRELERLRIFFLLVERQRHTQDHDRIGVTGVSVDGLLQILLRCHVVLFLVLDGSDNRIRL